MNSIFLIIAVLLPILSGILIPIIPWKSTLRRNVYIEVITIATAVLMWCMILQRPEPLWILSKPYFFQLVLKLDGLGMVFAGLVSILWPLANLYSFEYMEHDHRQNSFFMFYVGTYGITLGIACSGNLLTMYFFYEMLTLITVPLVIHEFDKASIYATRKYIFYSIGGAAMGFVAVVFMAAYGSSDGFQMGGYLLNSAPTGTMLQVVFLIGFFGFSVKAAMFPFQGWIPDAGVAPTPVTALLHAVAVVKSGVFAVIRLIYYTVGTQYLSGTWVHYTITAFVIASILLGSSMALKETVLKRRLAYSTVSNLSYILLGASFMTPLGLQAALAHLVFHAVMKINAFFCAGAIIHKTGKTNILDMDGYGKKMPWVYGCFTVSGLALMGTPGGCGFISKYYLVNAAVDHSHPLMILGAVVLFISALLTAIYMLSVTFRGFITKPDFDESRLEGVTDPTWRMLVPLCLFSIAAIVFGLYSSPLIDFLGKVAEGLL